MQVSLVPCTGVPSNIGGVTHLGVSVVTILSANNCLSVLMLQSQCQGLWSRYSSSRDAGSEDSCFRYFIWLFARERNCRLDNPVNQWEEREEILQEERSKDCRWGSNTNSKNLISWISFLLRFNSFKFLMLTKLWLGTVCRKLCDRSSWWRSESPRKACRWTSSTAQWDRSSCCRSWRPTVANIFWCRSWNLLPDRDSTWVFVSKPGGRVVKFWWSHKEITWLWLVRHSQG